MRSRTVDVQKLLDVLEIELRKSGPDELRGHCPNPRHERKPGPGSWQIRISGPKAGMHVCYSCGFGGGPVALAAAVKEIPFEEAKRWIEVEFGVGLDEESKSVWESKVATVPTLAYPKGTIALWRDVPSEVLPALDYVLSRGVTFDEVRRWSIGATSEMGEEYPGRLIVPIVVDRKMVDFVARLWVEKPKTVPKALSGRRSAGARKEFALWGYDDLDPTLSVVHVCEGVWGAVAMLHAGVANVVASCGSAWSQERTDLLKRWRKVVLVPDGDAAGARFPSRCTSLRYDHEVFVASLGDGVQPDQISPDRLREAISSASPVKLDRFDPPAISTWTGKATSP